jgi:hypothetical protein
MAPVVILPITVKLLLVPGNWIDASLPRTRLALTMGAPASMRTAVSPVLPRSSKRLSLKRQSPEGIRSTAGAWQTHKPIFALDDRY